MIIEEQQEKYSEKPDFKSPSSAYIRIKDMDKNDTPREKAEKYGCGILSTAELWALILRTGTVGMPITQLCNELMKNNDNRLTSLERRSRKELSQIKGMGKLKAIQIEAVMELIHRYNNEGKPNDPIIKCSTDIYNLMKERIGNLAHEEIWSIMLNRSNRVIKCYQASKGGSAASVFDTKMIIKQAVIENAEAMILCHNHPSGNTTPSQQDNMITAKCAKACETMDIRFLDHIIITANGYFSYKDSDKI